MDNEKLARVSRQKPCPVCGKPDWCLAAPDGSAAICQRIQEGSVKRCGEAGWLHILQERPRPGYSSAGRRIVIPTYRTDRDWDLLTEHCLNRLSKEALSRFAGQMGVSESALFQLYLGWNGCGYTFPMRDGDGRIVGIHIRRPNGKKVCEPGSRLGLFLPRCFQKSELLVICEGVSDTATALDLEFSAVGRASCQTGQRQLIPLVRESKQVVILGDNDTPGRKGAEKLAATLALYSPAVRIVYPGDTRIFSPLP